MDLQLNFLLLFISVPSCGKVTLGSRNGFRAMWSQVWRLGPPTKLSRSINMY